MAMREEVIRMMASWMGLATMRWVCLAGLMYALIVLRMWRGIATLSAERDWEKRMREELEAYARLDCTTTQERGGGMRAAEAERALAKRVCQTIGEKSAFSKTALLLRDAGGRLSCAGSMGMDDLTLAALQRWGEEIGVEEKTGSLEWTRVSGSQKRVRSSSIPLGEWGKYDREISAWSRRGKRERRRWRRAIVAPVRAKTGRMLGAIVVCADGPRRDEGAADWPGGFEGAMGPIEALAEKLARLIENEALSERLLRAEKMAGLGQLAGGIAHALNNPLTAVLGFSELIAEMATELRIRTDAQIIHQEAVKMKDTVLKLVEFWRPETSVRESLELMQVLRELEDACAEKLRVRGVTLEMTGGEGAPLLRGSRDRIRQVMEHLLNNAAQAIAAAQALGGQEAHVIRVTVSHDERAVQVMVSDTGIGFREPGRVFDPFYTTQQPGGGPGLGLSICYGIVREHGGEISALNLSPHGAAVVLELPVRPALECEGVLVD